MKVKLGAPANTQERSNPGLWRRKEEEREACAGGDEKEGEIKMNVSKVGNQIV